MLKSLELKIPPLVWVVGCAICMWACAQWLPAFNFNLEHASGLGVLLAALGLAIAVSGILTFRKARTTVNPMRPEQAGSLVTGGPYRFTRNPMYLGMLLVLGGWFLHLHNLAALVFLPLYVTLLTTFQILPEERAMERLFGSEYADYKAAVSRWFGRNPVPR